MKTQSKERYDVPVEPKAGAIGVLAVFCFGVVYILAAFGAAYMWTNADVKLAAAIGVASIVAPLTVGFVVSEVHHQRSGAVWFVLTAAICAGGLGAWSVAEQPHFQDRMDMVAPGVSP